MGLLDGAAWEKDFPPAKQQQRKHLVICGKQGVGKTTLADWIYESGAEFTFKDETRLVHIKQYIIEHKESRPPYLFCTQDDLQYWQFGELKDKVLIIKLDKVY